MNSRGTWAAVVAPVLAVLGLLLAALARHGVSTTAQLVMQLTYQVGDVIERHPGTPADSWPTGQANRRMREIGQRRSTLLFRFAPPTFLAVWIILLVCSLLLRT